MDTNIPTKIQTNDGAGRIDLALDYHAHILPGCDHGSDSLATSKAQLAMARTVGIRTICATPHFYPDKENVKTFLKRREATSDLLFSNLPDDAPEILLGAEVLICDGMERMRDLDKLCLQGTRELLLEMPFYPWQEATWDTLYRLHAREDVKLVIAHADRYSPADIEVLIAEGIPLQLNAECLTKPFHRRRYLSWIRKGYVSYIGSDIHGCGNGYGAYAKAQKLIKRQRKE